MIIPYRNHLLYECNICIVYNTFWFHIISDDEQIKEYEQ